ncbi:hypothetical protein F442_15374, partial [Phytophthora nicotianae P10297]
KQTFEEPVTMTEEARMSVELKESVQRTYDKQRSQDLKILSVLTGSVNRSSCSGVLRKEVLSTNSRGSR